MRPEAHVATRAAQIFKGEGQASGRNGRFINQKRTNGQISSFGLRMADFILSRIRSLSAARIKFYQQWPLYQGRGPGSGRNGRFIKQAPRIRGRLKTQSGMQSPRTARQERCRAARVIG